MIGMTIAALLLAQNGAGTPPSAKDLAVQELTQSYLLCLTGEAEKLDDHVSDAATIATVVSQLCGTELQRIKDVVDRGQSARVSRMLDQHVDDMRQSLAVSAILKERQIARAGHSN